MKHATTTSRRGFSLAEFLIAITISVTLLAATMSALDTSYKSYKLTTESASINMSTRLAMHRLTTLIRNADDFGPFPINPIAEPQITSEIIEFTASRDNVRNIVEVWSVYVTDVIDPDELDRDLGPRKLMAEVTKYEGGVGGTELASFTQAMMFRVQDARFLMDYDVGPRLRRATIDITVGVREDQADTMYRVSDDGSPRIPGTMSTPYIRMVSSVRPRRLALAD